jgi:hypothetical protein
MTDNEVLELIRVACGPGPTLSRVFTERTPNIGGEVLR